MTLTFTLQRFIWLVHLLIVVQLYIVFCFLFAKEKCNVVASTETVSVCVSLASNSSETVEVIIVKLGTMTTSDMRMHHMLIILTLTFIQCHRSES